MSEDLITWLRAQLDEDERIARACEHQSWTRDGGSIVGDHPTNEIVDWVYDGGAWVHIPRWDPARVLAEIQSKRRIVDDYRAALDRRARHPGDVASAGSLLTMVRVVKLLATIYAERPGY